NGLGEDEIVEAHTADAATAQFQLVRTDRLPVRMVDGDRDPRFLVTGIEQRKLVAAGELRLGPCAAQRNVPSAYRPERRSEPRCHALTPSNRRSQGVRNTPSGSIRRRRSMNASHLG